MYIVSQVYLCATGYTVDNCLLVIAGWSKHKNETVTSAISPCYTGEGYSIKSI